MLRHILCLLLLWLGATLPAQAAGELQLYNWGNYTHPELLERFQKAHDVKVTVTDFDSNDTALAKIRAGGHGFDLVVPSASFFPVWIQDGLLQEHGLTTEPEFQNIAPRWRDVAFDPGRRWSLPWVWGTTGITVNTDVLADPPQSWSLIFDPPQELRGKISIVPEMNDVFAAGMRYLGIKNLCTSDREELKRLRDMLLEARQHWASIHYGTVEEISRGDFAASLTWSGAALRARQQNPKIRYIFPKEGASVWMDNIAILKDAQNVENARLFMKFMLQPENAALLTNFTAYPSGLTGAEQHYAAEFKDQPELSIPADNPADFQEFCGREVFDLHSRVWADIVQ